MVCCLPIIPAHLKPLGRRYRAAGGVGWVKGRAGAVEALSGPRDTVDLASAPIDQAVELATAGQLAELAGNGLP